MDIVINADEWAEETQRDEAEIVNQDDILESLAKGVHPAKIAKWAIVCRELGNAEESILPPNKRLLLSGAASRIRIEGCQAKHDIVTENGSTQRARSLVKLETEDGSNGRSYIKSRSDQALGSAQRYLFSVVPGHIWNRFLTISENKGDVRGAAEELKRIIDEQVGRIVEPVME